MDFDPISRAIAYPFRVPSHSFILRDGMEEPLAAGGGSFLVPADRRPVLAIGSNRSPDRLAEKFTDTANHPIPVTSARLAGFDVVYSAHICSYGAVPATLHPAPGTTVEVSVNWLTAEQERRMHETESVGASYDYCRLDGIDLEVDGVGRLDFAFVYVGRRGALTRDGAPIPLAPVTAEGRRWPASDQPEVLAYVRDLLSPELSLEDFILSNLADPVLRHSHTDRLRPTAAPFSSPQAKVMAD